MTVMRQSPGSTCSRQSTLISFVAVNNDTDGKLSFAMFRALELFISVYALNADPLQDTAGMNLEFLE
jgi:hypothetical protein